MRKQILLSDNIDLEQHTQLHRTFGRIAWQRVEKHAPFRTLKWASAMIVPIRLKVFFHA